MTQPSPAARAEDLRRQLEHHNYRYYVLDDPEVSDGYILVGVENPADGARLESALAIDSARVESI